MTEKELAQVDDASRRLLEMYGKGQHASLLHEVDQLSRDGEMSAGIYGAAALACTGLERYEEAVIAAGVALQKEPGWAWLYQAFAAAKAGQKELKEALTAQTRAVVLEPGEPGYAAVLARYLRESGQPEHAAETARQALKVDPDHVGALNELSLALLEIGDTAGAMAQVRRAQSAHPADPQSYVNEGVLHLRAGARSEARRAFRQALRHGPGLTEAENQMAGTLGLKSLVLHLLTLGRITVVGWTIVAFLYYVTFRLLEMLWKAVPAFLPVGQTLMVITLAYLIAGLVLGHSLRWAFKAVWPR